MPRFHPWRPYIKTLCATVSFAELASANIVGYTTIDIQSKYQIVGVNFQSVDGTSLKLNDLIPYQEGMTKGNNANAADQIQIGDETGGWTIYYMSNGKNGKGNIVEGLEGKWAEGGPGTGTDAADSHCIKTGEEE